MKAIVALLCLALSAPAFAAPIQVVCQGSTLDPRNGRPIGGGVVTVAFEFDQARQSMTLTEGAAQPVTLSQVTVTPSLAKGTGDTWVYEVNRIEGVATIRSVSPDTLKYGIAGNFYRGTCAVAGQAKF